MHPSYWICLAVFAIGLSQEARKSAPTLPRWRDTLPQPRTRAKPRQAFRIGYATSQAPDKR